MAPQLPVEQTRRYGRYGIALGWVYAVLHFLLVCNVFVFIALAACLFYQARFITDGWGSFLGFWVFLGPMLTLGIPWMVTFWMYHVFFRLYLIIYYIVLVIAILWHAALAIIWGVFDIADKSDFYRGDSNSSAGDVVFWLIFALNIVLIIWYFIYVLFGIYIFRRTADRKMIDARARAEEVRPDTMYGRMPRYSYGQGSYQGFGAGRDGDAAVGAEMEPQGNAFTVGFWHALPIVAPLGAYIPDDDRDEFEELVQDKEAQGWELETLPFGVPIHVPSLQRGEPQPHFGQAGTSRTVSGRRSREDNEEDDMDA